MTPERASDILASIDLGSHTARLLIARSEAGRLRSLMRKRAYVRLALDFESPESGTLKQAGIERALVSLGEFKAEIETYQAARTGPLRQGWSGWRRTGLRSLSLSGKKQGSRWRSFPEWKRRG
jgi:hypothetical protein